MKYLLLIAPLVFVPAVILQAEDMVPAAKRPHWAFVPPRPPALPRVQHEEFVRTPIDRFVEAELEKHHLTLSPEADRSALLRRVTFDLIGLPPTPAEIAAFLADGSPDAYEKVVERLLASPHYGERWGKFWLDAAGYADSNGYFSADSNRPLAYRYRDYVIRAFNADKPYDRFVQEQLAGDELTGYSPDGDVTGEAIELLIATHFLRNAPDGTGESDGNPDEVRTDRFSVLEGNLQIAMNCLLGVTIQCARCHAHKFEPIAHEEYYRLQALLLPVYNPERWVKPNDRVVAIATRVQREEHRRRTEKVERQIQALEAGLKTMAGPLIEQVLEERLKDLAPSEREMLLAAFRAPKEKRTPEQEALLKQNKRDLKVSDDELAKRFADFAAIRTQVQKAIAQRRQELPPPLEKLAAVVETDPRPPVHHLLRRGAHNAPGPEVQPGVPASLNPANAFHIEPGKTSSGRRLAFARWVTSPDNPLFARVMVNRIWQHHFGVGLVATPDNLGQSGAKPSHPELLDYLATEFVRSGWSVKALHRRIVASAVYRQSSASAERGARSGEREAVPLSAFRASSSGFPLRRLDAEAVRDAMLAVAGELDSRQGGPYVPTKRTEDGSVIVDETRGDARRRSVYLQQRRTQVTTLLELFDAPAIAVTCGFRNTSTVPLQSLALMNSPFARARAQAFARRLLGQQEERLELAFRLACGRGPLPEERAAAERFLAGQHALYAEDKEAELKTWTDFCQMVLASNAFLYVD